MTDSMSEHRTAGEAPHSSETAAAEEHARSLADQMHALKEKLKRREAQLIEAWTDRVTGLRQRGAMYDALRGIFQELLTAATCADVDRAADAQAAIAAIDRCDTTVIQSTGPHVLFGDVAFLSLANRGGRHDVGDQLLHRIADVARDLGSPPVALDDEETARAPVVFYRHGGDEITAILCGSTEEARALSDQFRERVRNTRLERFASLGLPLEIDVGIAHVHEGLRALRLLLERGEDVPPGDRMRRLADLTVAIADRRSALRKGMDRIALLVEMRRQRPAVYADVISALRKGAFDVSDEQVDELVAASERGEDISPRIRSLVRLLAEREFVDLQHRRQIEFEVVQEIVDAAG